MFVTGFVVNHNEKIYLIDFMNGLIISIKDNKYLNSHCVTFSSGSKIAANRDRDRRTIMLLDSNEIELYSELAYKRFPSNKSNLII